jgi:hypothetical protein
MSSANALHLLTMAQGQQANRKANNKIIRAKKPILEFI